VVRVGTSKGSIISQHGCSTSLQKEEEEGGGGGLSIKKYVCVSQYTNCPPRIFHWGKLILRLYIIYV
jgi:hypothetical protein